MKDRKFVCPVSMECTQEEYDRDLKKPLEELGYEEYYRLPWSIFFCDGLSTSQKKMGFCGKNSITYKRTHFINHYNPELFLALASMTEGEQPIKGEWCIMECGKASCDYFAKFEVKGSRIHASNWSTGVGTELMGMYGGFNSIKRKATKEELIQHFSKEDMKIAPPYKLEDLVKDVSNVKSFEYDGEGTYIITIEKEKSVEDEISKIIAKNVGFFTGNSIVIDLLETFDIKFKK